MRSCPVWGSFFYFLCAVISNRMTLKNIRVNTALFASTSHTPALIDLVGKEQVEQVIDFCFIENPYYPPQSFVEQLQQNFPLLMKRYPSCNPAISKRFLAEAIGVNAEYLVVGNGATEIISVVQRNLAGRTAVPIPTFSEYLENTEADCLYLYQLNAQNGYRIDLNEYARWAYQKNVDSVVLINPGNPTGQLIGIDDLRSFLRRMKLMRLVIVDESFIDFSGREVPTLLPYVEEFSNLLIIRSMSKDFGIPGLRLGYCCSSNTEVLRSIDSLLPVWNLNTLAEFFLAHFNEYREEYERARLRVIDEVVLLQEELQNISGFLVYPSGCNFVFLKCELPLTARELQLHLLREFGVYVRDCTNKLGIDNRHIRVASQGRDKDRILIEALKSLSCRYDLGYRSITAESQT